MVSASEGVQGVRAFSLDATGNRTSTTVGGAAYSYGVDGGSNRLSSSTAPAAASSYLYDGFGQMLTDGTRYFTWTQAGELASATVGTAQTSYSYNGFGQRVKKVSGAGSSAATRHYLYAEDGVSLLGEYEQANAATPVSGVYEVVYLEGIPVLVLAGGQVFYVQSDHLNAPRTIKNSAGAVVWQWESDAFGNGLARPNPGGVSLFEFNPRFPGQQFDTETGLYYNNARYYDPATGRYISSDPIGLAGGLNTYGYVGQAPTGAVDPTGLWVIHAAGGVVGLISGGVGGYVAGGTMTATLTGAGLGLFVGLINPLGPVAGPLAGGFLNNVLGQAVGNAVSKRKPQDINWELATLFAGGALCGAKFAGHLADPRKSAFAYDLARRTASTPRLTLVGGAITEGLVGGATELGLNELNKLGPPPKAKR